MKYLWIVLIILTAGVITTPAHAACTSTPAGDLPGWGPTVTLNACNKTISAVTGVDWATVETSTVNSSALTVTGNSILTINNGGHLTVGTLTLSPGSSISIASGADVKIGTPLYVPDADADGFASTAINLATLTTATASGRRRLAFMRAWTADCGDSTMSQTNTCTLANGAACASDGVCTSGICGTNADGDNFFSQAIGHSGTCQATAKAYTDCYDANANAYPASAVCSSTHRGDGSFDYNCSGTNTTCGSTYYGSSGSQQLWRCIAREQTCATIPDVFATFITSPVGCGVAGYLPGVTTYVWSTSGNCCSSPPYVAAPGTPGTQACN